MLATSYEHTFPGRINTQFIGIASRYSQHKQRRKTEQARKKSLENSYLYSEHKERKLQRAIHSKSVELNRLQSSRLRKLEEIKAKEELNEIRQYQLEQLRQRNNRIREGNRKKMEAARTKLITLNHEGWAQLKVNLKSQTQSLKKRIEDKLKSKSKQCSLIREQESIGLKRVDSFHKQKNSENLEAYLRRIKQENRIKKENEVKAQNFSKELDRLNKSVSLKANYLSCLDQQISKYRTDITAFNRSRLIPKEANEEEQAKKYGKTAFSSMYKKDQ